VRGCAAASMRMCGVHVRVCVRACARIGVRAKVRVCARMRLSVHAFVCACECGRAIPSASIFGHVWAVVRVRACACVCGTTVCVRLGAEWALWGHAVLIARSATAARARLRSGATGFRCRARSAAGRTFSSRTLKAEWAARFYLSSVVDANGTIYVIGGGGTTVYNDVWASTDGGARAGLGQGGVVGGTSGHEGWVLRGTQGHYMAVLQGY
jgi:hypothetical protein